MVRRTHDGRPDGVPVSARPCTGPLPVPTWRRRAGSGRSLCRPARERRYAASDVRHVSRSSAACRRPATDAWRPSREPSREPVRVGSHVSFPCRVVLRAGLVPQRPRGEKGHRCGRGAARRQHDPQLHRELVHRRRLDADGRPRALTGAERENGRATVVSRETSVLSRFRDWLRPTQGRSTTTARRASWHLRSSKLRGRSCNSEDRPAVATSFAHGHGRAIWAVRC